MMNQIQQIKDKVGQQAESIISQGLGLVKKGKKYRCPNIYAHKNGDRNPSMSWHPEGLQYKCFTCDMKIDIYGYYRDHLNYSHDEVISQLLGTEINDMPIQRERTAFETEIKKLNPLTDKCREYVNARGINDETINHFNLQTYKNMIAFPYYKYEAIVGAKLRQPVKKPSGPKMISVEGSKPYLYNVQNVTVEGELIICEGEFDAMILHQCGFHNVVSVGAGANSLTTLLKQAEDFFNAFSLLIVVSDNDDAGQDMDKTFVDKFGDKVKVVDKKIYRREGSDVNEEFLLNGCEKVRELVDSARFKVEGRRDLDKNPYKGLNAKPGKFIPTGIKSIDWGLNDLAPGCTTLVSGRANGGKTTFIRQVIANAIDNENKVYLMNGENDAEYFLNELYQCVIGRNEKYYDKIKINKRTRKEPKAEVLESLREWHKGKLVMFNKGESRLKTIKDLTEMVAGEVKYGRHDLVIIDNLMSILSVQAAEKNEQQADFMQKLCDIAKLYSTHIVLVLHPNKTYQKGQDMDFEQISGTSDLYNKADNIISVVREYREEQLTQGINGEIAVLKNRYYEDLPRVKVNFCKETGLLLEIDQDTNQVLAYSFTWNARPVEGFTEVVGEAPFG